ncbi:TonB C-terminal domain-containing protein [Paraherbaspirillum soli]|uniref:TonB C-terminal domain-containing protein n=1 Tax=Paraherbaspirillum soli TaxID=631222 RepID=A0ABW0MFC9_9BURK
MKSFLQNRILVSAIAASVVAHAGLLAVRFAAPETFKLKPTDPMLEVILVNAKHNTRPVKAEALAQANLDGGGNADAGRAKSPLPDMHRSEDGDSVLATKRRIVELEQQQQQMLSQMRKDTPFTAATMRPQDKPTDATPQSTGTDAMESAKAMARREAEIAKNIDDYNKRPKKTQITPSTRAVGYAAYYKTFQDRVEKLGTLNFPKRNGQNLYGKLVVYIPIYQDGSLYVKEGGPRVERSSGNADLDSATLKIIANAAPFGHFPDNMRSRGKDDVWEVIATFEFTREGQLQAQLTGGNN